MRRIFRRLPLQVKLLLIGLVPLVFLAYMSLRVYTEKKEKIEILRSYTEVWKGDEANKTLQKEEASKKRTLIFLSLTVLLVAGITVYSTYNLTHAIKENTEQTLRSSERYKTIFYKSPLPKWIYDYETLRFLEVNEEAISHYGYSREEFLSITLKDIRPKEDEQRLVQHMADMKGIIDDNRGYWRHLKKDGEMITVEVTAHFIDYNGRKARMAVIKDITEKLKAEENLSASEKRFRSIIEQFPYPVISYDPEGNCTDVNHAWEIMWQDKRENVKGYNIRKDPQMIASGLSRYIEQAFAGQIAISEPYLYDPALIGQKGRKRWMVMTLYPLKNEQRELLEVILILQDITDKKIAEEQLKQSHEELRELASRLQDIREEERASMAREVHDELGQQITCLKMDISWVTKKMNSEDADTNKKIKEIMQLIDNTAATVRKIATDLRPSILDDFGLIEALQWQSREFEKKSGISIQFKSLVPEDFIIPQNISVALFRIYQESLTNIARHSAASVVIVNIQLKDGNILFTIKDNGKGFDVNEIAHKKTLGLLGMKERTTMIGGKYEITSEPDKGTSAVITVPL